MNFVMIATGFQEGIQLFLFHSLLYECQIGVEEVHRRHWTFVGGLPISVGWIFHQVFVQALKILGTCGITWLS